MSYLYNSIIDYFYGPSIPDAPEISTLDANKYITNNKWLNDIENQTSVLNKVPPSKIYNSVDLAIQRSKLKNELLKTHYLLPPKILTNKHVEPTATKIRQNGRKKNSSFFVPL